MWNGRPPARARHRLRKRNFREPQQLNATGFARPEKQGGFLLRSAWPRTLLSAAVAASSLWIVAISQGVPGIQDRENETLSVRATPLHDKFWDGAAQAGKPLYIEVKLHTSLSTRPPRIFREAVRATRFESNIPTLLAEYDAFVLVRFWTDAQFKTTAPLPKEGDPARSETLRLQLSMNREIEERVGPESLHPAMYERQPAPESIGFIYYAECPLERAAGMEYICRLRFKAPLDGSKGLAQFHWEQSLTWAGPGPTARVNSIVQFDPEFEDVKVVAGDGLDESPQVRHGKFFHAANQEATVGAQVTYMPPSWVEPHINVGPADLSIDGTNPSRKDLVDLLAFGMAALFGAAAASLFEQASSALRRRAE